MHPDTGATSNYIMAQPNIKGTPAEEHKVMVPTGKEMTSTQEIELDIPNVAPTANKARIFNELKSGNLLSVGKYCDQDCSAHFFKHNFVLLNKHQRKILTGPRDWTNRLWKAKVALKQSGGQNIKEATTPVINAMIE